MEPKSLKYPRTFHLPYSPGATSDDKIVSSSECLIHVPIIISEKLDGENSSLEHENVFARTHAAPSKHPSADHLKKFHASIKHLIPSEVQLFCENVFAVHSIAYEALLSYVYLFAVRQNDTWLAWEEVEGWAMTIGAPSVPVLFSGSAKSEKELKTLVEVHMKEQSVCGGQREGVVVRVASGFKDHEFPFKVQKCVRQSHVKTSNHWKNQPIVRNKLKAAT